MVYWNEKFPKILVLSLIFPILRAPVPKYWEKKHCSEIKNQNLCVCVISEQIDI